MRKKILIAVGIFVGLLVLGSSHSQNLSTNTTSSPDVEGIQTTKEIPTNIPTPTLSPTPFPTLIPTYTAPTKIIYPTSVPTASSEGLSNDKYYTNVDGNQVHSPAYSDSVPQGATAVCGDGTYSFSQHRQGTCSHHGGVARWL